MASNSAPRTLDGARKAKQDEFYTQLADIENELRHYRDQLSGKVILCNCDDPYESNFFKYFSLNFNVLGIKKLICTSYAGSPIVGGQLPLLEFKGLKMHETRQPYLVEINHVPDQNNDGAIDLADVRHLLQHDANTSRPLLQGGDFRSDECINILQGADVVVTNPPFSLFPEFLNLLIEHEKEFVIIGNTNSITYKDVFPLIMADKVRTGNTNFNVGMIFEVPSYWEQYHSINPTTGKKYARVSTSCWYTNLAVRKHQQAIPLFKRYIPTDYPRYVNFDAIEVAKVSDIPVDYEGFMGVPITFLDKHNPSQFEIIGSNLTLGTPISEIAPKGSYSPGGPSFYLSNEDETFRRVYTRIVIKHRRL